MSVFHPIPAARYWEQTDGSRVTEAVSTALTPSGTGHIAIYPLLLHRLRPDAEIVGTGTYRIAIPPPSSARTHCVNACAWCSGEVADGAELDEISFHHAAKTRQKNDIPYQRISLLRATESQPILFPIFDDLASRNRSPEGTSTSAGVGPDQKPVEGQWDIVICNPPFFASEQEMKEGQEAKIGGVPAVS